jgi:hypothetical protein
MNREVADRHSNAVGDIFDSYRATKHIKHFANSARYFFLLDSFLFVAMAGVLGNKKKCLL